MLGAGVVLTFSRGAWIALAAAVVAGAAVRNLRVAAGIAGAMVAGGAGLALVGAGPVGDRLASLGSSRFSDLYGFRFELAERAASAIAHHPLTGPGVFRAAGTYVDRPSSVTHPHDLLLGVAVFFGTPAAVAFTLLLATAVHRAVAGCSSASRGAALAAAGALAGSSPSSSTACWNIRSGIGRSPSSSCSCPPSHTHSEIGTARFLPFGGDETRRARGFAEQSERSSWAYRSGLDRYTALPGERKVTEVATNAELSVPLDGARVPGERRSKHLPRPVEAGLYVALLMFELVWIGAIVYGLLLVF